MSLKKISVFLGQSENPVVFSLPVSRIMRTVWIV